MQPSFVSRVNNNALPRKPFVGLAPCSPWSNAAALTLTSPISPMRSFWRCATSSMPLRTRLWTLLATRSPARTSIDANNFYGCQERMGSPLQIQILCHCEDPPNGGDEAIFSVVRNDENGVLQRPLWG